MPLESTCKDISTVDDDVLRPWTRNPKEDQQIDASVEALNETITSISYERNAGAQGASTLDRQPVALSAFANLVQNEDWLETALDQEQLEHEDMENENDELGDDVPLAEDEDLLHYLQEVRSAETRPMTSLLPSSSRSDILILDGDTERFRQLQKVVPVSRRVRSAAYMPNIRSPMYRDWLFAMTAKREARRELSSSLRPQNNSCSATSIEQRRPSTSSGRLVTSSSALFATEASSLYRRHQQVEDSAEVEKRIFTPASSGDANKRQLPALTPTFASLFADDDNEEEVRSSRPSTLSSPNANTSPLQHPQTVDISAISISPHRRKMLESLGLPPPSSRNDSKRIVITGAAITTKRNKRPMTSSAANEDGCDASVTAQISSRSVGSNSSSRMSTPLSFSDRHEASSRPITPALGSIGISPSTGTTVNVPTYTRRRLRQMKSLRDQLLTSTGSFNLPTHPENNLASGAQDVTSSYKRTQSDSRDCAKRNQVDSTWDVLQTAGYLEKVGTSRIYMSQTADYFKEDSKRDDMVRTTDKSYFFQTDDIRKWTDEAVKLGKKPFVSGGVIRI